MESTYGDRNHADEGDIPTRLAKIINAAYEAGGNIIVPTFAIERAQELLYFLSILLKQKRIPRLPVFLDSPMANRATAVFAAHQDSLDSQTQRLLDSGTDPFDFPGLHLTTSAEQSKAINAIRGSAIILAGSGMCTGGRIKHHLVHNITNRKSTILFVGYQAEGTLGRIIVNGAKEVRILGSQYFVQAKIEQLHGMSAHADHDDLLRWVGALNNPPRHLFLTHGEESAALHLADDIRQAHQWTVTVPQYKEVVELD
jgi:metallo-beta-lactamase family protein